MIYKFGSFELDTERFELRKNGQSCKIEPQVFALLELLVSNAPRMVSKDEINLRVWGGRAISDAAVNSRIRAARRAVGDDGTAQRLIQTVHGRGFRFIGQTSSTSVVITGDSSAREALDAAHTVETSASGEAPSIAVLPLQLLTPDERYGTLGDAVSQEVIIELSRLHWLFVISRGSSFRFREPGIDLADVGRILGARYILSGTIAFADRNSIVSVELANAHDGRILWTERFECPVEDLLLLRMAISSQIVSTIEARIQMAEAREAAKLSTENLDAWSAHHRGLWHMYRFNKHDNEIAARMFERAIAADPDFARGYAGLSFTHFQNVLVGYSHDVSAEQDQTRKLAEKSLELDPLDPFVNLTMGRSKWIAGDMSGALPWFERSVELSPNFAFAHYNRGLLETLQGKGEFGEESVNRAMKLSPIDPLNYAMLATRAMSYLVRGDFESAAEWSARAIRSPNAHVQIFVVAAICHDLAGKASEARKCAEHVRSVNRNFHRDDFLRSFDFREDTIRKKINRALDGLAL